jgi:hypothetical protein
MKFHAIALAMAGMLTASVVLASDATTTRLRTRETLTESIVIEDECDEEMAAQKVTQIIENNRMEAAMLRQLAGSARTASDTRAADVFMTMAEEHTIMAGKGSEWLVARDFPSAPEVTVTLTGAGATDTYSSVEHLVVHHERSFNESLARRQGEHCASVRGLLLEQAAATARHLSMLRDLRPAPVIQPAEVVVRDRVIEIEKPVIQDRIVEKTVEVEKIVEKQVFVDKFVDKPIYRESVAGEREIRVRRRPAK